MDTQPIFCEGENETVSPIKRRFVFFIQGFILSVLVFLGLDRAQWNLENYLYADISRPISNLAEASSNRSGEQLPELNAKAALVKKIGPTGRERFIFKFNPDAPLPLASLTKLMTAVVVAEGGEKYALDAIVTISGEAAGQEDVPVFGNLKARQNYTVGELLGLMMQYSSNDAAYALSEAIGTDAFIKKMNQKAEELGLTSTFFLNSTGLDLDDGRTNISSAKDLAALTQFILTEHRNILDITAQEQDYATLNGIHSLEFWDGQTLVGGKTGYTVKAGGCMVVVSKDGKNSVFINVLLGAKSPESRVAEMQKLINLANNQLKTIQ